MERFVKEKEDIRDKFKLPENSKISFFRNPNEFTKTQIERINPTHRIILYGLVKKKYDGSNQRKINKIGKIYIPSIAMIVSFFSRKVDEFHHMFLNDMTNIILLELFLAFGLTYLTMGLATGIIPVESIFVFRR